jgi:hypothetical protein
MTNTIETINQEIENLPKTSYFNQYYGSWAFSEEAGEIERKLQQEGSINAWKGLGNLYKKVLSFIPANEQGSGYFSREGSCTSRQLLSYWAIRSYLKANEEEKAIEMLKNSKDLGSVIFTIRISFKESKEISNKVIGREFDLPNKEKFQKFCS